MPSNPNINDDAPATFQAYPEMVTKTDAGTTVPDGDLDKTPGATLFNFYDTCFEQINQVFQGTRKAFAPVTHQFFGSWADASKQYLDARGESEAASATNVDSILIPADGWIECVFLQVTANSGSTTIRPSVNGVDGTAVTAPAVNANTSYKFTMGTAFSVAKGDLVTFSVDTTTASSPGDVNLVAVMMLDFNTL